MAKAINLNPGADSTLVNASYRMGMANVPHDTSKIFEDQYDALAKIEVAKTQAGVQVALAGGKAVQTYVDKKKWERAAGEAGESIDSQLNQMTQDYLKNSRAEEFGLDEDQIKAQEAVLEDIKDQIETLENMPGIRSREQNEKLKQLRKNVDAWRAENNEHIARDNVMGQQIASDNVDYSQSFKVTDTMTGELVYDRNMAMLFKEVTSKGIPLSHVGIQAGRNANGERGYYYDSTIDRTKQHRQYLSRLKSPIIGETSENIPVIRPENRKFITTQELYGMVKPKDKELANNILARVTEGIGFSTATDYALTTDSAGNVTRSKNKILTTPNYGEISAKGRNDFYNILTATHQKGKDGELGERRDIKAGIIYLSNNPIQIGNAMFNYNEDSKKNPKITSLTYSKLGLKGSVDKNNDGYLSDDELSEKDFGIIHNRLMNPRTPEEVDIAAYELSDYLNRHTEMQFNKEREKMTIKSPSTTTTPSTANLFSSIHPQGSLNMNVGREGKPIKVNKGELNTKREAIIAGKSFNIQGVRFDPIGNGGWARTDGKKRKTWPSTEAMVADLTGHKDFQNLTQYKSTSANENEDLNKAVGSEPGAVKFDLMSPTTWFK